MNILRDKRFKKISAALLIALLVFINAVKILHTHNFSLQTTHAGKNAIVVKAAFNCNICDFQIAKDSDAEIASYNILSLAGFIDVIDARINSALSSFSYTSSVRGPPVFA